VVLVGDEDASEGDDNVGVSVLQQLLQLPPRVALMCQCVNEICRSRAAFRWTWRLLFGNVGSSRQVNPQCHSSTLASVMNRSESTAQS